MTGATRRDSTGCRVRRQISKRSAVPGAGVLFDDRLQVDRARAVQDDAVTSQIEVPSDGRNTLLRCSRCRRRKPVLRNQRRNMLELFGRGGVVDRSPESSDKLISSEALKHGRIPVVRTHHQVAIRL